MSRLAPALAGIAWIGALAASPALAQNAQSDADRKVQDLLTTQKATTDLRDKRCALGTVDAGEIVVCAPTDPDRFRFPGRETLPSAQSTKDGLPRAPDLKPVYPGPVVARGCFIPPCPPPKMVFIDVKALPQAPEGSDADRIAKGEIKGP